MKVIIFIFLFSVFTIFANAICPKDKADLIKAAVEGQKKAYASYSNYCVGAAVLTKSGKIYSGCNVENASYGLTVCAERIAIFKAVSEGNLDFEAVAVVTKDGGMPCGACRQVLNEFSPNMIVLTADEKGELKQVKKLCKLLPNSFGPSNLQ